MSEQFIKLHTWMTELGLNPSELIVFAVIHGYTASCGSYRGGVELLGKWCGQKRQNVYRALAPLVEKGYVKQITPSKGRHTAVYVSLVNRLNTRQLEGQLTVSNRDGKPSQIETHIDIKDNIDNPPTPLKRGSANADAKPERRRRPSRSYNRALNYIHGEAYTKERLKELGVSFGEELYGDDETVQTALNEIRT